MGLKKSLFTNVAKTAFSIAGEAIFGATYHQKGAQSYDTNTRIVSYAAEIDLPIDVFEEAYKTFQIDGQIIKAGDTKFVCIQDDLAAAPQVNEWLTVEGVKYIIVSISKDPINATWIFQCRV